MLPKARDALDEDIAALQVVSSQLPELARKPARSWSPASAGPSPACPCRLRSLGAPTQNVSPPFSFLPQLSRGCTPQPPLSLASHQLQPEAPTPPGYSAFLAFSFQKGHARFWHGVGTSASPQLPQFPRRWCLGPGALRRPWPSLGPLQPSPEREAAVQEQPAGVLVLDPGLHGQRRSSRLRVTAICASLYLCHPGVFPGALELWRTQVARGVAGSSADSGFAAGGLSTSTSGAHGDSRVLSTVTF